MFQRSTITYNNIAFTPNAFNMCKSRLEHLLVTYPLVLARFHSITRACDFGC